MNFIKSIIMNLLSRNHDKLKKHCDNERFENFVFLMEDIAETLIFLICIFSVIFLVMLGMSYILYLSA